MPKGVRVRVPPRAFFECSPSLKPPDSGGFCFCYLEAMRYILSVIAGAALAAGCAARAYEGARRPSSEVCRLEGSGDRRVVAVDGQPTAAKSRFMESSADGVEVLPGRHVVTYGLNAEEGLIIFQYTCRGGHTYRLTSRKVPAGLYGERTVWTVEDPDTREVIATQR